MKRAAWFDAGAAALKQLYDLDDVYACPLCQQEFDRSALNTQELTIEHVPPKCVNGREMLLTCKECNAFASREYDKHMQGEEHARATSTTASRVHR